MPGLVDPITAGIFSPQLRQQAQAAIDALNELIVQVEADAATRFDPAKLGAIDDDPPEIGLETEGGEAALDTTWDQHNPPADTNGVLLWTVSRVVYNHAGDRVLYAMVRPIHFDSLGHMRLIGPETRISVDAAEDCES